MYMQGWLKYCSLYVAMNLEENDTGETPGEAERQGRDFVQRRVSFLTVQQVNKTLDVENFELDPVSDTRTVQLSSDPTTVTAASPQHGCKDVGEQYYKGRRRSSVAPLVVERFTRTRERRWSVSYRSSHSCNSIRNHRLVPVQRHPRPDWRSHGAATQLLCPSFNSIPIYICCKFYCS